MPQNFIACDRDQELLPPPNLREWLPEDHLAWFVLAAVKEMDVSAFLGAYRADGHGRPAANGRRTKFTSSARSRPQCQPDPQPRYASRSRCASSSSSTVASAAGRWVKSPALRLSA